MQIRILGNLQGKWIISTRSAQNQQSHNKIHINSSYQRRIWNSMRDIMNKYQSKSHNHNRRFNTHCSVSLKGLFQCRKVNRNIVSKRTIHLRRYLHLDSRMHFTIEHQINQSSLLVDYFNLVKLNLHIPTRKNNSTTQAAIRIEILIYLRRVMRIWIS